MCSQCSCSAPSNPQPLLRSPFCRCSRSLSKHNCEWPLPALVPHVAITTTIHHHPPPPPTTTIHHSPTAHSTVSYKFNWTNVIDGPENFPFTFRISTLDSVRLLLWSQRQSRVRTTNPNQPTDRSTVDSRWIDIACLLLVGWGPELMPNTPHNGIRFLNSTFVFISESIHYFIVSY